MTQHPNRSLVLFLALGFGLSGILALVLTRSLPLLIKEQMYSCQTFIQSISIELLTCQIRNVLMAASAALFFFISFRLLSIFLHINKLQRSAINTSNRTRLHHLMEQHGLSNQVVLIPNSRFIAFCFGLHHPLIFLSTGLIDSLDDRELQAVLLHEKHHLDTADSLTLFIASTLLMIFPFFPILADLIQHYRLRAEMAADRAAIEGVGSKLPLLSALQKMLRAESSHLMAVAALADATLSARIEYLTLGKTTRPSLSILSSSISFVSVSLLLILLLLPADISANEGNQTTNFCLGKTCAVRCSANPAINSLAATPAMSIAQ